MKNLEEAIIYTRDKKKYQIDTSEESYLKESIADCKLFLKDSDELTDAVLGIQYLSTWYHWNFIYTFLTKHRVDYSLLSKSTVLGVESNNLESFIAKKVDTYDEAVPFTNSIKHLAQMLYLGWEDKAVDYGNLLLNMLYGKQYKGWHSSQKHPWFMLELFCKWQGIALDYAQLRNPNDMGVYQKALDNWDTEDTQLLSNIIDELTEFHIQQSDEYEHKNKDDGDFTSANYFIFPIEILMWLSIRRIMGLAEYNPSPKNQLMQMEINKLPAVPFPYPKDELVEQVKEKLLKENPTLKFELNY